MTTPIKELDARCSGLDILMRCPASVFSGHSVAGTIYEPTARLDPREVGTAVHELIAKSITTDGNMGKLSEYFNSNHITDEDSIEEVTEMLRRAEDAWDYYKKYFPKPTCEHTLNPLRIQSSNGNYPCTLSGTVDCVSPRSDGAVFIDWKTGYLDEHHVHQRFGYATLLWKGMGSPEDSKIYSINAYLRKGYRHVAIYTPDMLRDWLTKFSNAISQPYVEIPNDMCIYCNRYHECKARKTVTSSTIESMISPGDMTGDFAKLVERAKLILTEGGTDSYDDPSIGELLDVLMFRCDLADKSVESARDLIKQIVSKAGSVTLPDNRALTQETVERKMIVAPKAWPILQQMLSTDQIVQSTSISLAKLTDIYKAHCPASDRKNAYHVIRSVLEKHGAMKTTKYNVLKIKELNDDQGTANKHDKVDEPPHS